MSLTGGHLDAFLEAGLTAEQIVALVKADIVERERVLEEKRAKDAERQRRHRESRDVTVTNRDGCDTPFPLDVPPKVSPTPPSNNPPLIPQPKALARPCFLKGIGLPDWIPAEPWQAFCRMRKAKDRGFTEDAAKGAVRKLDKMRGQGFDPGKLLWRSVDNGWKGFFEHDDCRATTTDAPVDWNKRAAFYESIGKKAEAEDCRRKVTSIGRLASDIARSATA